MKHPVRKKSPSKILAAIHETASGFYKSGTMDKKTMCEFDQLCLMAMGGLDITAETHKAP